MSKFNQGNTNRPAVSPFITERAPSALTHEGAPGYIRDQKTQAFFLAVGGFLGGEDTFYEKGTDRDERFKFLIRELSVIDPDWVAGFLVWLRGPGNIRTASIIGAAEYVWARRDEQGTGRTGTVHPKPSASTREVVAGVLQRADEPGEILAYWYRNYGKNVPKPLKRGISDAVSRLYHEYSIFKYNSPKRAFSMADVLNISHAKPTSAKEVALY